MRNIFNDKGMLPFEEFLPTLNWDSPIRSQKKLFRVDVKETDTEFVVHADLAGVKKEDIAVEYKNRNLIISATKEESHSKESDTYIIRERGYGHVYRSFYIENINEDMVTCEFNNGLLTVTLPKLKEGAPGYKKFEIK